VFEGAADLSLDIPPVDNGNIHMGRVWAKKGTLLTADLALKEPVPSGSSVQLFASTDADGIVATMEMLPGMDADTLVLLQVPRDGWVNLGTESAGLGGPIGLTLTPEYHGTEEYAL
jgi:hypothetical protein